MLNFTKLLSPLAIALSLALSANAYAGHGHHSTDNGMGQMVRQLDLSAAQRQDIRQVIKQARRDRALYRQDERQFRQDIRALVQAPQWDEQATHTTLSQSQSLLDKLALQKASSKHQVWQLLSAQQQGGFLQAVEDREPRKRDGHGATRLLKEIALSDEQSAAILQLKTDLQASRDAYKIKRQAFKQAERALIQSEAFSQSAWQAIRVEYQQDLLAMALLKAKSRHDSWQILTTAQQAQLKEQMAKHGAEKRHGKKHGERQGRS